MDRRSAVPHAALLLASRGTRRKRQKMAAGGGAARRCWRRGVGLARAVRGICGSGRATAALRAEDLAERLRKSEEQQREVSGVRAVGPGVPGLQLPACKARAVTGSGTRG